MVGCAATGEALIVDPMRDISPYLEAAEQEGLTITHVTETHIHADFVSGTRELAHRLGARKYLSDMGDDNWKYGFADDHTVLVRDGDTWMVGNIKVEVMHTPGHTPEHISFMITDTAASDHPIGIFTGDFLFVGDVGRPDLLEEAAGMVGTADSGARLQFQSVQRVKALSDHLQIWPAHGAGSACGKALGAIPSSTLGYEKLVNPAFQFDQEQDFVDWLLDGQPPAPRYFAQMKKVNKIGPELLENLPIVDALDGNDLQAVMDEGHMVIDTRSEEDYNRASLPHTLNIPSTSGSFNTYAGWFVDFDAPVYLIAASDGLGKMIRSLRAVGVDYIMGYFSPNVVNGQAEALPLMNVADLAERLAANEIQLVDVRNPDEYQDGHISQARNIPLGWLPSHYAELTPEKPVVVNCLTGIRSQVAASLLRANGFKQVANLEGGFAAWKEAGYPVEIEAEPVS